MNTAVLFFSLHVLPSIERTSLLRIGFLGFFPKLVPYVVLVKDCPRPQACHFTGQKFPAISYSSPQIVVQILEEHAKKKLNPLFRFSLIKCLSTSLCLA